jgi:hypothetical protein
MTTEKKDAPLTLGTTGPPEFIEGRSLHRKLAQVMYEAERIPKRGRAPQAMGGYPFVQVGDAADFIRKSLAEKVVTMMPTNIQAREPVDRPTKAGGIMTTVDLVVDWTITDGESGESIIIQSFGAGADSGDKYSGKAMTSAMKYAFLAGFLLSTGDDVELGSHEAATPAGMPEGTRPPVTAPDVETEDLMGDFAANGMVRNGSAAGYKLEPRQGPTGHVIGFRMEFKDEKSIPQVVVEGPAGETLFLATSGNPAALLDTRLHVKGRLFNVRKPGRQGYKRLRVSEWENADYSFPAKDAPPADDRDLDEPPDDLELFGEKEPAA